ncbi:MAG: hypothetical protein AAB538_04565 [Patescibacteria group bacterium]
MNPVKILSRAKEVFGITSTPQVEKLPEEDFMDRFWEEHKILRWPVVILIALVVSFILVTALNLLLPETTIG